ncbi:hypothetical protein RF11_10962 [Thelohanellus kitauei]|uniref:Uncharacterized protein n=1 Tax=Thelohanellus kitauei TaxID=669202 RepID=A0A0C2I6A7_THEKT|nr:hypothetical protein RF11_10962 [Thelohanellus kitauei]
MAAGCRGALNGVSNHRWDRFTLTAVRRVGSSTKLEGFEYSSEEELTPGGVEPDFADARTQHSCIQLGGIIDECRHGFDLHYAGKLSRIGTRDSHIYKGHFNGLNLDWNCLRPETVFNTQTHFERGGSDRRIFVRNFLDIPRYSQVKNGPSVSLLCMRLLNNAFFPLRNAAN